MKHIEINLLELDTRSQVPPATLNPKRKLFPRLALLAGLLVIVGSLGATAVLSYQQATSGTSPLNTLFSGPLSRFSETPNRSLAGELDDRINILLLGIGGAGHDGAQLTDTVMVASIKPSTEQVGFISLPRDLLVPLEGYGWRKINNANAFAEMSQPGSGPQATAAVVSKILNLPIHYTVRVDFSGFEKLIDILGGVDVTVDKPFTDYSYPTEDYKYQTISFKAGQQTMDGKRALMFARSRHSGYNNEGSDFARSKRQQKILVGVRNKILTTDTLLNPGRISDIISTLNDNITTTIRPWELIKLALLAKSIPDDHISHIVFDDSPNGLLVSSMVEGAYVLQPQDGTFEHMQLRAQTVFALAQENAAEIPVTVAIKNGTKIPGLASQTSSLLSQYGFSPVDVANASVQTYQQTAVYDMTSGKKKIRKEVLEELLKTSVVQGAQDVTAENPKQADVLVIIGSSMSTQ